MCPLHTRSWRARDGKGVLKICRKVVKSLFKGNERQSACQLAQLGKLPGETHTHGRGEEQLVGQDRAGKRTVGEPLTIETALPGKTITTGKLGEVMQESVPAAVSVVRNRSRKLGIEADFYQKNDIHIHLPEGATPKDGPSAGIGICTALVSVLTGIPVRANVAMTGEITLRGEVLPIGGLKEKLLAAHRGGIKTVLIPEENTKDLAEIPDNVKNRLDIHPVKWIDEVLALALERAPEPLPEKTEQVAIPAVNPSEAVTAVKH
jgi:ATP-dependent Lon protease